jgi:hypothetical protein
MISHGLNIIANYPTHFDLFVVNLLILVACCSRLGPIYVIRVYNVNFV